MSYIDNEKATLFYIINKKILTEHLKRIYTLEKILFTTNLVIIIYHLFYFKK